MKILALLDVDEEQLKSCESNFEDEMGWVAESGISIDDYIEIEDTDEPQRFLVKDCGIETL